MINAALETLILQSPPLFHSWGGKPQSGGFSRPHFDLVSKCISALDSGAPKFAIETGAGLSTLWLLNQGFNVASFVLSQEVVNRMSAFLIQYPELQSQWRPAIGYSELTLPAFVLSAQARQASLCLIDGGHGVQTVFVDFVYLNYSLINGGFLLVDDIRLPGPKLLDLLLRQDQAFSVFGTAGKLKAYQTLAKTKLLGDWYTQKELAAQIPEAFSSNKCLGER